MDFNTRLLHGKAVRAYSNGGTLPEISQVNAYRYGSAEEIESVFRHRSAGFAYSRVANPTVAAFEQRLCEIEGGMSCIGCASGMTAISLSLMNILSSGDEIIASSGLYGGSIDLFRDLSRFGIKTRFAKDVSDPGTAEMINDRTRAIFAEVISNPALRITDIEAAAKIAHDHGIPLIVDGTTATPYLINPIAHGADIVIHSTTKYINGSGDAIGGAIIDSGNFKWDFERFTCLSDFKKFGKMAYSVRIRTDLGENLGGCMNPTTAFLSTIGLETLGIRMDRICSNAFRLAEALDEEFPGISVNYPLVGDDKRRALADRLLGGRGGGILTFRAGSKEKAFKAINALRFVVKASSVGDVRTLVIHPESTLYIHNEPEEVRAAGVYDDTIRVSVGIEDVDDLIEDFVKVIKENIA